MTSNRTSEEFPEAETEEAYGSDSHEIPADAVFDDSSSSSSSAAAAKKSWKCRNCNRAARRDCKGSFCIRCCQDPSCAVHEALRAKARWKQAVKEGSTQIQKDAISKRSRKIPKGRFKEDLFQYMNDTIVLWDLHTIEPKVRDEILRRSRKNNQSSSVDPRPWAKRNYTKRSNKFKGILEDLYQKSQSFGQCTRNCKTTL